MKKVGLKINEAADQTSWREGVRAIAEGMRCTRPPLGFLLKPAGALGAQEPLGALVSYY